MLEQFSITQRHYNIIIEQVQKNYPYESGGFVGGKEGTITAIFPVLNQDISNKTDVFAIYPQDIERAHLFFEKHGFRQVGVRKKIGKLDDVWIDNYLYEKNFN